MSDPRRGSRRALALGFSWGAGHAATLFAFGLPVVLFGHLLPEAIQQAAEVAVGVIIVALAVRLLVRWRRGYLHAHPHRHHDGVVHAHPHVHDAGGAHEHEAPEHRHAHPDSLGRSPLAAFGIGLVHGLGGSAGAAVLLLAALPGRGEAAAALALFAAATAVSMALCSSLFGRALARRSIAPRLVSLAPAFGVVGVLFGIWYALGALSLAPYAF